MKALLAFVPGVYSGGDVATLTIRNLDENVKSRLRRRAAEHDRSMEEEVRVILREAVAEDAPAYGLGSRIAARFAELGGEDIALPQRREPLRTVELDS